MRGDVPARERHLRSQKNLTAALEPQKGRPVRAWASGEEDPEGEKARRAADASGRVKPAGDTRRAGAGAKLQGRPEPMTEAGPARDEGLCLGDSRGGQYRRGGDKRRCRSR